MAILVDKRTGSKDLYELLPNGYREMTDLEFGDAIVCGHGPNGPTTEAIERKRLSDVLGCIQDGRFAGHQLRGLRRDYDFVWLVIEDEIRADPQSGILQRRYEERTKPKSRRTRAKVEGRWVDAMFGAKSTMMWRDFMHWLFSMRRVGGIDDFYFTRNARETADFIWTLYTWRQKRWSQHKSVNVFNTSVKRKRPTLFEPSFLMRVAKEFDDVSWDTAAAIDDYYGSDVDKFWSAPPNELAQIVVTTRKDGVDVRLGSVVAGKIAEQRRSKRTPKVVAKVKR